MEEQKKHIASFSGGKDSAATIILAHENNEPLDEIIFAEVMFDENISGELPEHIDFIKNKCIPLFESWGYKFTILHSDKTYMDCFNHIVMKSKVPERVGKRKGFVMTGHCDVQRDCKLKAINNYWKNKDRKNIVQYIGIAIDEPKRLERLEGTNNVSLLAKYGYTEQMAYDLCKKYDLLSPVYDFSKRGGCWFCPNAKYKELRHLWENHKELFMKLVEMEKQPDLIGDKWNVLTGQTMQDNYELMYWEDAQMNIFDLLEGKGQ